MTKVQQSVKENYIYNTVFILTSYLISFFMIPYISRVLGATGIGEYSFANSIVTYFVLFAVFGSDICGRREVAVFRDNKERLSRFFWNNVLLRFLLCVVCLASYVVILKTTGNLGVIELILALKLVNVFLDISWLFQGLENFKLLAVRNLTVKIIAICCVFIFVKTPSDINLYVFIECFSIIMGNIVMWMSVPKIVNKPVCLNPFSQLKYCFVLFVPTVAVEIYTVLDKSMLGWIVKSNYVSGCYEQSEKVVRALLVFTALSSVLMPRIANLHHDKNKENVLVLMYKAYDFVFLFSVPMIFGLIAVSSVFIPLFLGKGFDDAVILTQVFSLLLLFVGLASTTGMSYLVAIGKQNVYTVSVAVSAVINFCLNLILIRKYSALGAAVASVIAEFLGCSIQIGYCIKNEGFEFGKILKSAWKYVVSGAVMFIVLQIIKPHLSSGIVSLFVLVGSGAAVYFACLLILKDSFLLGIIHRNARVMMVMTA